MPLNIRRRARIAARVALDSEPWYRGSPDRYVERLDEDPRFCALAYSTLLGAVRAAARELGRLDGDDNLTAKALKPAKTERLNRLSGGK